MRQSSRMPFFSLFRSSLSPLPLSNGPIRLRRYPFLVSLVSLVCLYAEIETLPNANYKWNHLLWLSIGV